MSVVTILSGKEALAFASLVDHGLGRSAIRAAPWIKVTNISPISQAAHPLPLAGARYDIYIKDEGQTFVGCVATAAFNDPITFTATDIVDEYGNSVIT